MNISVYIGVRQVPHKEKLSAAGSCRNAFGHRWIPIDALSRASPREFGKHCRSHGRLIEAPAGANKVGWRRIAADAIDDHRRRQEFNEINQSALIVGPINIRQFAASHLIRQRRVLHAILVVDFDGFET
jgi:hypothetical protein